MTGLMMPKRRGIFGSAGPSPANAPTSTAQPLAPVPPEQPKKEGINWMGVLADALSGFNGGPAHFANRQWEQRQIEDQRRAQAQRDASQRTLGMQDFIAKEQWKRANPEPVNNDTEADYAFWQSKLTPQQFETWKQNRIDPPQYRQGPDMQFYRINPTAPPQITEDDWNSAPVHGGPTQPASGGFPR